MAELEDRTQVESSHLARQTRATWSLTEMMCEREELAATEATGSSDRHPDVPRPDLQPQTSGRCHQRIAVPDGVGSSELFGWAMFDWSAPVLLASWDRDEGCRFWHAARLVHRSLWTNGQSTVRLSPRAESVAAGRPTLLEQYPFQQRILVPEHQTLIRRVAVTLLQCLQSVFMVLDRRLQLLDILCSPLPKSGLSLTVPLLPLFGCGIDLRQKSTY